MNLEAKPVVPAWYWAVVVVALLWNLLGCVAFGMEMFAQDTLMETMTEEQQKWARSIPGWIYIVYGAAVISGTGGSLGLLVRKWWSFPLFAISLPSVLVQMGYTVIIAGGMKVMGPSGLVMPALVVVVAGALLWFSQSARSKAWLGSRSSPGQTPELPA